MSGPASAAWTCPTCKVAVATPFCSTCGEKHKHPREFTFAGLMAMVYSAFSPIDGKLLRSILHLVRYPGRLTQAYQYGQRMPYMGRFQLVLIVNVAFFAVQSAGAFTVFSLQFYSFLLILLAVPVVAMEISVLLGGPAVPTILADQAMSVALLLSCAVYLYVANGPVFEARDAMRVFQAAILAIAVAAFFLAYRFLPMPITFHTT